MWRPWHERVGHGVAGAVELGREQVFSADRPIENWRQDRLGRKDFAFALADALSGWDGNDALVAALYGTWGSGKSSIKNMALGRLVDREWSGTVIQFAPWQFAGQNQLFDAFFSEIALALGERSSFAAQRAAAQWALWGARLKLANSTAGTVQKIAAGALTVLAIFGVGGLVGGAEARGLLTAVVAACVILALVLAAPNQMINALAGYFRARAAAAERTLPEIKQRLRQKMGALDHPVLVVIDDVDRLQGDQTRLLLQLVKASSDLPHLVFLLVAQRETLEEQLDAPGQRGRDFLQKIVQVPFNVPAADQTQIDAVLSEGLEPLRALPGVQATFDESRWLNLYLSALRPYFRTLRDVHRFLPTLRFYLGLLGGERTLEVNALDLVALETLRHFEPDLYARVSTLKESLTTFPSAQNKDRIGAQVQAALGLAPAERHESLSELVRDVFPTIAGVVGGKNFSPEFAAQWEKELRVTTPSHFDRYFRFRLSTGDVPRSEIDAFLGSRTRDEFASQLRSFHERSAVPVLLDRLEAFKEDIPSDRVIAFSTALMDVGDLLPPGEPAMFAIEPPLRIARLITWSMKKLNQIARAQSLLDAVTQTTGFYSAAYVVELELEAAAKSPADGLPREALEALRSVALNHIRAASEDRRLLNSFRLGSALFLWRKWAGEQEPKDWVKKVIYSEDGAVAAVLRAFTSYVISSGLGSSSQAVRWYLRVSNLEIFVELQALAAVLEQRSEMAGLDERTRRVFDEALRRRAKGLPDYDPSTSRMEEDR